MRKPSRTSGHAAPHATPGEVRLQNVRSPGLRSALGMLDHTNCGVVRVDDLRSALRLYTRVCSLRREILVGCIAVAVVIAIASFPSSTHITHATQPREQHHHPRPLHHALALAHHPTAAQRTPPLAHKAAVDCAPGAPIVFTQPYVCGFGVLLAILDFSTSTEDYLSNPDNFARWPELAALIVVNPPVPKVLNSELGLMTSLKFVLLQDRVEGSLPSEIGNAKDMNFLSVDGDGLSGTVPSQLGQLTALVWLTIKFTTIGGPLPSQLGLVTALTQLDFRTGWLTLLPSELGLLTNAASLDCTSNRIAELPTELFGLTSLTELLLGQNGLHSRLETEIAQLSLLTQLNVASNRMYGTLPTELGLLVRAKRLVLAINSFEGTVPTQLMTLTQLNALDLSWTQLHGTVASEFGLLVGLSSLRLSGAQFSGTLPSQLGLLTALVELLLDSNAFWGSLPRQLGHLSVLGTLDVHGNRFTGTIPHAMFALPLFVVTINDNSFHDTAIPESSAGVWLQDCDYSGISHPNCQRKCPSCTLGEIEFRGCDQQGYGQACIPSYYFLACAVVFVLGGLGMLRIACPRVTSRRTLLQYTALAFVDASDLASDIAFCVASAEPIKSLSLAFLLTSLVSSLVLSVRTLTSAQFAATSTSRLTVAVLLCTFSPSALKIVTGMFGTATGLPTRVLGVKLVEDVPQVVLQVVSISHGLTTLTLIALAFSVTSALSNTVAIIALWLSVANPKSRMAVRRQGVTRAEVKRQEGGSQVELVRTSPQSQHGAEVEEEVEEDERGEGGEAC